MATYIRRMAKVFHALRVDNAHGTPLHVAAAMIDAARAVRPQLYVNAELFTGSLDRDVEYVSRLGINSLVREAMQAGNPGELARYVYSYGGSPIASLRPPFRGGSVAARVEALLMAPPLQAGESGYDASKDVSAAAGDSGESGMLPLGRRCLLLDGSSLSLSVAALALQPEASPHAAADTTVTALGPLAHSNHHHHGQHSSTAAAAGGTSPDSSSSLIELVRSAGVAGRWAGPYGSINGFPLTALALASQLQARQVVEQAGASGASTPAATAGQLPYYSIAGTGHSAHVNEATVAEVLPAPLPALFFDCTHDNQTANEKRHPADALAAAVVISAAVCAGGTTRGTDILVPENLSVVTDHRLYGPGSSAGSAATLNTLDALPHPPTAP